jgi:hypothetical protein
MVEFTKRMWIKLPSSMPHLMVAKKVNPNASIDFYIGNIAPDTIGLMRFMNSWKIGILTDLLKQNL